MAPITVTVKTIQIRRSFTAGYRPPTSGTGALAAGETLRNYADKVDCHGIGNGQWIETDIRSPADQVSKGPIADALKLKLGATDDASKLSVSMLGRVSTPTLATVLARIVAVEDYRDQTDGADWGPALTRAWAAVTATGGVIQVSTPGKLLIASQVKFPNTGGPITLRCLNKATVFTNDPAFNGYMFYVGSNDNTGVGGVDVEGFSFYGADKSNSYAFSINNANGMTFRHCYFLGFNTAINSANSFAVTLDDVVFKLVTAAYYSSTAAHNFVARRVKAYDSGTIFNFQGATDNVSVVESDFENCATTVQINGGTALRFVGNYNEYQSGWPIVATAPLYGSDISNNWIALGQITWSVQNMVGGQLKGNSIYNQNIAIGAGTVDFEIGDNRLTGTSVVATTPYQSPALANSWTQQANYSVVGFRKGRDGKVHLRGNLLNSTASLGTAAFALPPDYRPGSIRTFSASNSANGLTAVQVGPDGAVKIMQTSGAGTSANPYQASLDGIAFEFGA